MKEALRNKAFGFRLTLACILFSAVTAVVYALIYSRSRYMSWAAFGVMLAGVILTAVLILLKQYRFAPAVLMTGDFLSLLLFVYYIYFYISSVATGIQFSGFPPEFFVNIAFYAVALTLSVVCVFMKQTED